MAKKKLTSYVSEDADNPVMQFLNNAAEAENLEEETEIRKRAKEMNIDSFTQIPELRDIFPRDRKIMDYLVKAIQQGYDPAEPIVYWKTDGQLIIVDGNTRYECSIEAGRKKILAIEHEFNDLDDAIAYAKHRQVRRNLSDQQVYMIANIELDNERGSGRDVEIKAEMTGLSPSTIQHAKTVEKKASEEVKKAVKSGEMSINEAYNTVNPPKKSKKKKAKEQDDDISEALDDTSGDPKGLAVWDHSDGIERPEIKPYDSDDSLTKRIEEERKASYEEGHNAGLKEGCELAEKLFYFAIAEMRKGRTADEVLSDERVSDFSPSVIIKFELPEEDENGGCE